MTDPKESQARTWAMLCHLSSFSQFIGIPFGGILGPLICWLVKKDEFPFVNDQGKESLNFQISIHIYYFISFILVFVFIGIILALILFVMQIILVIIASVKANNGEYYRYPFTIRFIK